MIALHLIWITMYHMRRRDKEVADPGELRRVLLEAKYVTLALCVESEPYLATLSHGYDVLRNVARAWLIFLAAVLIKRAREGALVSYTS